MQRLQRNAWRGLLTIAVLIGLVGVWPLLVGIAEDPSVPLGLTGRSLSELAAESPDGFRLADFITRGSGLGLIVNGALLAAIAVSAFRLRQRWAWWAMWALPVWCLTVVGLVLANGVSPGQAPPWPLFSGSVFGVLSAALLLASAPRFFARNAAV